ncbi:MAG: LCP family protein [Oscillospiraceae bacterium]|nr:LCP family protein [Oscillospiraceae bacterium]
MRAKKHKVKKKFRLYNFLAFTLTFIICLSVFGVFTAIFLLIDQDNGDSSVSISSIAAPVATVSDINVLFCYDIGEKPKNVIANLKFSQNAVAVSTVADRSVNILNRTDTLAGHYLYGGISALKSAVSVVSNSEIDKFFVLGEDALAHIVDSSGGISFDIGKNIIDESGKILLEKGLFRITGAQAVIIIKYTDNSETITSTIIDTFLSLDESNKAIAIKYILSSCNTDVSYADYYDISQFLKLLKDESH